MLFGQPQGYHRWDGSRFVLAPMPPGGLLGPRQPLDPSPALLHQASVSHAPSIGVTPTTGGGDSQDRPTGAEGKGGNPDSMSLGETISSLAPDRGTVASGVGGALLSAVGGPVAGAAGQFAGGMLGGYSPARAGGSTIGSLLGGVIAGPIGAIVGSALGNAVGSNLDGRGPGPEPSGNMDYGYDNEAFGTPAYSYEGPMTLENSHNGVGLGGIGAGATGPMGTTAQGVAAGYGALGTPSGGSDGSGTADSKVVCTAMCEAYGFGSFRQKLWLAQSKDLAPEYQKGYHAIFRPLIERAYGENGPVWLRKTLEHIARHRTADIWKQKRGRRDWIGAVERAVLEPLCFIVGRLSSTARQRAGRSAR